VVASTHLNIESAEVQKIKHYKEAYEDLLKAVIEDGSWYDYSGDGDISVDERMPVRVNQVRVR